MTQSIPIKYGDCLEVKGFDVYFCDIECTCTDYVNRGCGQGGCASSHMLLTRSCTGGCAEESTCAYRNECNTPSCYNYHHTGCHSGHVYYFNSCNQPHEKKEHCGYGCSNGACNPNPWPKTVSRGDYSFNAYDNNQIRLLKDFLGIEPSGDDLDTYLKRLNNFELMDWESHWVHVWATINKPNTNSLIEFTQAKRAEYFQECNIECPNGWTCFDDSCYKQFGLKNWVEAHNTCQANNGHLVTVNSDKENTWVRRFSDYGDIWIGFNDLSNEGVWVWASGSSTYLNWNHYEPNNAGNEDCAQVYDNYKWNDVNCGNRFNTMCELYNVCSDDCQVTCPNGWTCRGESCYLNVKGNWFEIKDQCNNLGAHIITVNDRCENLWAKGLGGWLGYNDLENEGVWTWANGHSNYEWWAHNEPNNAGNEDCAEFRADGSWNDNQCIVIKNGLCEVENPCPVNCDDGNSCTIDYCSPTGCVNQVISPCEGNGVCEPGENYCNSNDCPKPVCGSCMEASCVSGGPECVYSINCCGNNLCEQGESCDSCPSDCGCSLGIDLTSIECFVNDLSCAFAPEVRPNDSVRAVFYLTNASHQGSVNVKVDFRTNTGFSLGGGTFTSSFIDHSFNLPGGRQSVLVLAEDLINGDGVEALIFTLSVSEGVRGVDNYCVYPFDFEPGVSKGVGSEPINPDYVPAGGLLSTIGLTTIAGAAALIIGKKWSYRLPSGSKSFLTSVFHGIAGSWNDGLSIGIDLVKTGISFSQYVAGFIGLVYPPAWGVALVLMLVDNVIDGSEFAANVGGALNSYAKGDPEGADSYLGRGALAFMALIPVFGDFLQDGAKLNKLKFKGFDTTKQLSSPTINRLRNRLSDFSILKRGAFTNYIADDSLVRKQFGSAFDLITASPNNLFFTKKVLNYDPEIVLKNVELLDEQLIAMKRFAQANNLDYNPPVNVLLKGGESLVIDKYRVSNYNSFFRSIEWNIIAKDDNLFEVTRRLNHELGHDFFEQLYNSNKLYNEAYLRELGADLSAYKIFGEDYAKMIKNNLNTIYSKTNDISLDSLSSNEKNLFRVKYHTAKYFGAEDAVKTFEEAMTNRLFRPLSVEQEKIVNKLINEVLK